ncbi:hypothetical protein [Tsuneonella mangrovi]|uniref:hypothetical protein n=1 Tax=Tsuneonella mangrovi TaxID=1982042 RepID=UPI000BA20D03|nr:hypothetical protein [Tsuneonella mangrovi]
MKKTLVSGLLAIALAAPLAAQDTTVPPQQSPGTFSLPPAPSPTPTTSDVQGPIDPQAPYETRPRAEVPAPSPTPRPTPTAAPTASPTPGQTSVRLNGSSLPRFTPAPSQTGNGSSDRANASPEIEITPTDTLAQPTVAPPPESASAMPSAPPAAATVTAMPSGAGRSDNLFYALVALAALAVGALAIVFLRRRQVANSRPPEIVRPRPVMPLESNSGPAKATPAKPPAPSPAVPARSPVLVEAVPMTLSRSMMNATLEVHFALTNRSGHPLSDVAIEADLISAHGREPAERQLADPAASLPAIQQVGPLEIEGRTEFDARILLPVGKIRPLAQSGGQPYVPLLRVRVTAEGEQPSARTFLIGKIAPAQPTRVMPFQLDEMPQVHSDIGLKPLD